MDDDAVRAASARKASPFLDTAQAAFYVGLSRRGLEKMRTRGGGPRYRKHGRYVRYHITDLEAWSASRSQDSTSEAKRTASPEAAGTARPLRGKAANAYG